MATGQEIKLRLNSERIDYWLSVGAQTSDRVAKLLKQD
jgi:small subunit ribosomal protein S16